MKNYKKGICVEVKDIPWQGTIEATQKAREAALNKALDKFRKQIDEAGVLDEAVDRMHFVKKSVRRRREASAKAKNLHNIRKETEARELEIKRRSVIK